MDIDLNIISKDNVVTKKGNDVIIFYGKEYKLESKVFELFPNVQYCLNIKAKGNNDIKYSLSIDKRHTYKLNTPHHIKYFNFKVKTELKIILHCVGNVMINTLTVTDKNPDNDKFIKSNGGYVVAKGSGGLGDIMNVLVRAWVYADCMDRKLIVDWRNTLYDSNRNMKDADYFDFNPFDLYFESPVNETNIRELTGSIYPEVWSHDNLHLCISKMVRNMDIEESSKVSKRVNDKIYNYDDKRIKDYEEEIVVFTGPNIKNLPKELEAEYYKKLRFKEEYYKKADEFIEMFEGKTLVGVHYRHGNGEFGDKITIYDKYFAEVDKILGTVENAQLIIVSDSLEVIKIFEARYSCATFYPKWFPKIKTGPIHKHPENKDRFENGKDAIVEMIILSKLEYLVHNYSSFNWYAIHNSKYSNNFVLLK